MKKVFLCLSLCLLVLLTGCGKEKNEYQEVAYAQYESMVENTESFVLYVGAMNCTYCQQFQPTFNQVIRDYKLDVKYINIDHMDNEAAQQFLKDHDISGTPTVLFIENGKVKLFPRIEGNQTEEVIIDKLKKAGYIK